MNLKLLKDSGGWDSILKLGFIEETYGSKDPRDIDYIYKNNGYEILIEFNFEVKITYNDNEFLELRVDNLSDLQRLIDFVDMNHTDNNLPTELTAENGAKALLVGEFKETHEINVFNEEGEEVTYLTEVPVSWSTIKDIYKRIVEHYTRNSQSSAINDKSPIGYDESTGEPIYEGDNYLEDEEGVMVLSKNYVLLVKVMQDNDSHYYWIPEELVMEFDQLNDSISGIEYMDNPDLFDEFAEKFEQYRTLGDPNNCPELLKGINVSFID